MMTEGLTSGLLQICNTTPLVYNITNFVAMNTTANALLALGTSPVMAHAREEVEEITALAAALVINIGALSRAWVEYTELALSTARLSIVPAVFDPVGAGGTTIATNFLNPFTKMGHRPQQPF